MNIDDVQKRSVIGRACLLGFGIFVQSLRVAGGCEKSKGGRTNSLINVCYHSVSVCSINNVVLITKKICHIYIYKSASISLRFVYL